MQYRREIDGLRAVAVLPVILFHAGFQVFSGGYVGVDVFFVISGYLITSIILSELEAGKFSIVRFYERRARRILPALFLVMGLSIPAAWFLLLPSDLKDFFESLAAVSVFSSNILFWQESGYFATAAELKPMLHTWSLAVEEQYYLIFPLLLMLFWSWRKRWIFGGILAIGFLSLLWAQFAAPKWPASSFFLLHTRAWELMVGGAAAFLLMYGEPHLDRYLGRRMIREVLGVLGLLMIALAILIYDKYTIFPSAFALLPTMGTAFIILSARADTLVGKTLGSTVLVGVGLISYSAYLWHQPLFAFARHYTVAEPSVALYLILSVASLVLAYISWRYIEKPFRTKGVFSRKTIFSFALIGSVFFIIIGLTGHYTDGFKGQWQAANPDKAHVFTLIDASKQNNDEALSDDNTCRFHSQDLTPDYQQKLIDCTKLHGPGYAVLGDSHAIDLYYGLAGNSDKPFIFGLSRGYCRPGDTQAECHYDDFLAFVERHPKVFKRVIYEQAGFYLMQTSEGGDGSRALFNVYGHDHPVPRYPLNELRIKQTQDYLQSVAKHVPVTWLGPRLDPYIKNTVYLKYGCDYDYQLRPGQEENYRRLDLHLNERFAKKASGALSYLSQLNVTQFKASEDLLSCKALYWYDDDHWSAAGDKHFGKGLVGQLIEP